MVDATLHYSETKILLHRGQLSVAFKTLQRLQCWCLMVTGIWTIPWLGESLSCALSYPKLHNKTPYMTRAQNLLLHAVTTATAPMTPKIEKSARESTRYFMRKSLNLRPARPCVKGQTQDVLCSTRICQITVKLSDFEVRMGIKARWVLSSVPTSILYYDLFKHPSMLEQWWPHSDHNSINELSRGWPDNAIHLLKAMPRSMQPMEVPSLQHTPEILMQGSYSSMLASKVNDTCGGPPVSSLFALKRMRNATAKE